MSLEGLVAEIRSRAEAELAQQKARIEDERTKIAGERDRKIAELRAEGTRLATLEASRERAQRIASAKLQARKLEYEARERQMSASLGQTRQLLSDYTKSPEYPKVLQRMFATATDRLGKQVKVYGRAEDATALRSLAGKSYSDSPVPVLGGIIVETTDGSRRLNLTFDELLRLREDRVRELLAA